jgi:hypothetical protein
MSNMMPMMMMMVGISASMMCAVSASGALMFQEDLMKILGIDTEKSIGVINTSNVSTDDEEVSDDVLEDARRKEQQALSAVDVNINKPVEIVEGTYDIVATTGTNKYLTSGRTGTHGHPYPCHDKKEDIHGSSDSHWEKKPKGRTTWNISRVKAETLPQYPAYHLENYWRKNDCVGYDQKNRYLGVDRDREHRCGTNVGIAETKGQSFMWFFLPVPNEPNVFYIENVQCRVDNAAERFLYLNTIHTSGKRTFTSAMSQATRFTLKKVTV